MPSIKQLILLILAVLMFPVVVLGHGGDNHSEDSHFDQSFSLTSPGAVAPKGVAAPKLETSAALEAVRAPTTLRKATVVETPTDILEKLRKMFQTTGTSGTEPSQFGIASGLLRQSAEEKKLQPQ